MSDSLLVPRSAVAYRHEAMATIRIPRHVALGALAVVTLILAVSLTATEIHRVDQRWREIASTDAYAATGAFAEAVDVWLDRRQYDTIQRVSKVMTAGPFYSVEVVVDAMTVVSAGENIGPVDDLASTAATVDQPTSSIGKHSARWFLETLIPMTSAAGFVRTQRDVSLLHAEAVKAAARIGMLGFGSWVAFGAFAWGIRRWWSTHGQSAGDAGPAAPPQEADFASVLVVDLRMKAIHLNGTPLQVSPKQFAFLSLLASDESKVFSEEDILKAVWPNSKYADANDVRQCVYQLRRRLDTVAPGSAQHVRNVKGFGYRFVPGLPRANDGARPDASEKKEESNALCEHA